jgi:hypothetical protein
MGRAVKRILYVLRLKLLSNESPEKPQKYWYVAWIMAR